MNATGSSERSTALVLLLVGLALVGAWAAGVIWEFLALGAVIYLVVLLLRSGRSPAGAGLSSGQTSAGAGLSSGQTAAGTGLSSRVELLERRVTELQALVDELRGASPARAAAPAPSPPLRPAAAPPPPPPAPPPTPQPSPALGQVKEPPIQIPARSFDWGRTISTADLLGAKALAFAGGVVTLLGVIFFFVLAVNRGWIGPEIRVASGGVASAILIGAGLWLKRRYGTTYSALAAVGAGIAGAYATLLAAVSLYDMVSKPLALVIAAAIATVGVAVSLAWSAEIVAAFGLIGAMVVPATLVFQGGLQEIGTAFVAVVFAGAAVVAARERWWRMLQVAALVSVPQAIAQIADASAPHAGIVTLAIVFWLLYVAAGLAFQLRLGPALAAAPASFLTGSAVFAGVSGALLYGQRDDGLSQGIALLVVAAVYVALAAALFRRVREPATLLWALGLAAAAVGLAEALSGSSLTYAWAAEAALLAWLSSRVRDERFQLPALVYLGLALIHALALEASPDHLFEAFRHPASGAPALLAIALAALVFAGVDRSRDGRATASGVLRALDPLLAWLRAREAAIDATSFALASLLTVYAASLGILELFQAVWPGNGVDTPFEWGHVAITAAWSLGGLAAVTVALRRGSAITLGLALSWLALTVGKVLAFDAFTLEHTRYGISFLIVGAAALLAGLARELASTRGLTGEGAGSVVISLALVLAGALTLVEERVAGMDGNGLVLVGIGALYSALGAGAFTRAKQRDLSTLLWTFGLAVVAVGEGILLAGVWLVTAYAVTAAALAALSVSVKERRLQVAALVYLAAGAAVALVDQAPPSHLVFAKAQPGAGVPSLLLVIGATATLAWALGWNERHRLQAIWVAGALAVYAASLSILQAVQWISPEGVHTDFQRGHTIVSAFWGLLALISLYLGLTRDRGRLRGGGFILFGISLGKIFLFDLPSLSSVQRALSFLAVGAVLLLGGFFYQRLSAQFGERNP
jgi:uncharacterized membrane protein